MAATDARPVPIKNVAFRAVFPILDADGDLVTGAASLDSEVSKDQGAFADCTNEATEIATSSGMYYLDLTSTEMNADCVAVIVKTGTAGAKTTVLVFYPEETGDINVDVTAFGGTAGTFSGGRAEVNTSHAAGTAWNSGAIGASTLASDTIAAAKIATGAITSAKFAAGAIDATAIANAAIDAATFAAGAIDAAALAADAGTEIGTAVWASATRTLTAATNITSTGGTTVPQTGDSFARIGAAGASLTDLGGFSTTAKGQIQTEAEEALQSHHVVMVKTTIATLASQTSFTLTAGSADNDAYNGCEIVIEDSATAAQKAVGVVEDYTGATKTVTLRTDPAVFTMAAGDLVTIRPSRSLKSTVDNRTLDVTTGGEAGLDWANVGTPGSTVNLSATTVNMVNTLTTYTGNTPQTGDSYAIVNSGVHGNAAIKGYVDDIGVAGAGLTGIPWNAAWDAEVQSEVDDALIAKGLDHLVFASVAGTDIADNSIIAMLVSKSATADWDSYVNTTDSLEANRDNIGTAGAGLTAADDAVITAIAALNNLSSAQAQTAAEAAIVTHRLDELLNADSDIDGAAPPTVGSVFHELMSKTAGSFTFDQTTDSNEAIRDRGDAAWTTATGFSTHTAADVWAVATRVLTAGTNIVLAKGTGVTGFNDLSAAQVNAEVLDVLNVDTLIDGKTIVQAVQYVGAICAGRVSGAGTGTEVFKGLDEATTRVTITVDSSGNRTDIVYG